ncbi:MAG: hypothetical protein ABEI58_00515 [Candidatus Nanohaloarchaea archaeon]
MRQDIEEWLREKTLEAYGAARERLGDRASLKPLIAALFIIGAIMYLTDLAVFTLLVAASAVTAYLVALVDFNWSGIELTTFTVVMAGMVFGPVQGAIAGIVLVLLQFAVGQQMGIYVLWVVPSYGIAGAVAGIAGASTPVTTGIGITVGLHLAFTMFTSIFTPGALSRYLPYAVGNTLVNIFLFQAAAGPVLALLM